MKKIFFSYSSCFMVFHEDWVYYLILNQIYLNNQNFSNIKICYYCQSCFCIIDFKLYYYFKMNINLMMKIIFSWIKFFLLFRYMKYLNDFLTFYDLHLRVKKNFLFSSNFLFKIFLNSLHRFSFSKKSN